MDTKEIAQLLEIQCGVISRRQVLELDGDDNDIERLLRRRVWARVFDGVYVNHTGTLSWEQRAWAAVLLHWPAALAGGSALRAHGLSRGRGGSSTIEIAVALDRHPVDPAGVRSIRLTKFEDAAQLNLSPPRVRVEHAALTVAAKAGTDDEAVAVLADACQLRRTTPDRLASALRGRPRLRRRRLLLEILDDVSSGAYSALERRYFVRVERPHGLPTGSRQRKVRVGRTTAYRDVDYLGLHTLVELDGRLGHELANDRWDDLERDIDSAVAGDLTVRAGWRQVLNPCRLAAAVAKLLMARAWTGAPRPCGPGCPVPNSGDPPAPDAGEPPESAA